MTGHRTPAAPYPLPGTIERIVVFRALMLGDMLCAVPALRSIRHAFPAARLTLIGLPWARELAQRFDCIDDFIALPGYPGLPETACEVRQLPAFFTTVQERSFDLALQMHGSGGISNPLVGCFGARVTAGFHDGSSWVPPADTERHVAWPGVGHEIERLLTLTRHMGWPDQGMYLEFPLTAQDRLQARGLLSALVAGTPYAVVHAGAQLPSRRWPVDRFAALAQRLAAQGLQIVLTGSVGEKPLVRELAALLDGRCLNLAGETSLWTLGAVIEGAHCLVCNDTGTSHIAAALGCRSLVISCGADVARWAPLDRTLHQVRWLDLPCRPCTFAVCPIGHGCAESLGVEEVASRLPPGPETTDA